MLCQMPRTATVWWRVTYLVVQLIPSIPRTRYRQESTSLLGGLAKELTQHLDAEFTKVGREKKLSMNT